MVAHAQHAVAERLERLLGAVDLRERVGVDRRAVREARGEARAGRLVRARHASARSERPYLLLADAGLEQRMDDAVLLGRAQPGRQSPGSSALAPESSAA